MTNVFRPVRLRTDVGLPGGVYTLSLSGCSGIRVWQMQNPASTNSPLLVSGQTVTNGVNGVYFLSGEDTDLYVEAVNGGTATLNYSYTGTGDAEDITCEASLKMTVWEAKVGFVVGNSVVSVDALQVGTWEDAFMPLTVPVTLVGPDFVNLDAWRFRVRVEDAQRTNESYVTISLSALVPDGGTHGTVARTVTLPRVAAGVFMSTNLLLVSDAEDAACNVPEVEPGISNRLYLCELGGTVRAEYADSWGLTRRSDAAIGTDVKTVTLDVFVMTTNGVSAVTTNTVSRDIADMAERYAQSDVRVQVGQVTQVEMPAGIATNWWVADKLSQTRKLTPDAKLILDALPRTAGHLSAVYVHAPLCAFWWDRDPLLSDLRGVAGMAVPAYGFMLAEDAAYQGCLFVSSSDPAIFTLAHEAGHILSNEGDREVDQWKLMYILGAADKAVKHPKRFTTCEISTIKGSPYAQ